MYFENCKITQNILCTRMYDDRFQLLFEETSNQLDNFVKFFWPSCNNWTVYLILHSVHTALAIWKLPKNVVKVEILWELNIILKDNYILGTLNFLLSEKSYRFQGRELLEVLVGPWLDSKPVGAYPDPPLWTNYPPWFHKFIQKFVK